MSKVIGDIAEDVTRFALQAWFAMLLLGAVHHDVLPWVPALGWWDTVLTVWLLNTLLGTPVVMGVKYGIKAAES